MDTSAAEDQNHGCALALVFRFLHDAGYERTVDMLASEAGFALEQVDDARDTLENILTDYQGLYTEKHGRPPALHADRCPNLRLRPESIIGTTKLYGTAATVSQDDFFRVVCANATADPSSLFCIELPLSCARRFRPSQLTLTPLQEHLLYGLVGCGDVGWRLSSVHQNSRTILEEKYGITKRMLQLFFKNRCQQKQRRKRKKSKDDDSRVMLDDASQRDLLSNFAPIAPTPSTSDLLPVNSLLEMVKGEEFDTSADIASSMMHPQTLRNYTPSAHLPPEDTTTSPSGP